MPTLANSPVPALLEARSAPLHDARGNVFIGTDKGLFCVGECAPDAIDERPEPQRTIHSHA